MVKITVEDETQSVSIENKKEGVDINAPALSRMFYTVMLALGYSPVTAKSMFSDEVDL